MGTSFSRAPPDAVISNAGGLDRSLLGSEGSRPSGEALLNYVGKVSELGSPSGSARHCSRSAEHDPREGQLGTAAFDRCSPATSVGRPREHEEPGPPNADDHCF